MKKLTLLIVLLLTLLSAFTQSKFDIHPIKKIEANPINIAVMLTQELDTSRMASTCSYYGYSRQTSKDGYTIFIHPNGSIIRYKFTNPDQKYPTIEVTSKTSIKRTDQTLKNLNFQKNGNDYVRKSVGYTTHCISGAHGFLILTNNGK